MDFFVMKVTRLIRPLKMKSYVMHLQEHLLSALKRIMDTTVVNVVCKKENDAVK